MTLTRKLASALCLVFLFITLSSNAQVDSTTGNLINYGTTPTDTTSTWNNGVYVSQLCFQYGQPGNCGPNPSIRAASGSINFSYGTTDLNQVVNINKALAAGGSGVQLSGFNFSFTAKNGNGWDDGRQDYLAAYVKFYNASGSLAANYDYSAQTNQRYGWTAFNFNETFANPSAATNYSNAQVGFVGRDNNYWAGNYGPEIYNVGFSLKYRVDPCALNPAYSPNCAGFKDVSTSSNLVPSPGGYAVYGDSINQSYAINVALANAGSGAVIHGFQWGYVANANGPYCAFSFIVCWDQRDPSVTTNVNITNSAGASLYNVTREYRNSYNTTEYSYLFPSSQQMSTLGNFNFTASTNDQAYIGSMWSRALYTADPCAVNPLSSPTCPGYAVAFAKTITATAPAPAPAPPPELAAVAPALAEASPTTAQAAPTPPPPAPVQDTAVAQSDPAQPSPTQPGPAPTGSPAPAGGPPQTTTASSSNSSSSGPSSSSAGPSKLAMSVLKTAQANDKATQQMAVQNAAKTLETASQSSQASSNMAISMNQDMSANSAVTAAAFASQSTQTSIQASVQASQPQQAVQSGSQAQQVNRGVQQVQQQEVQTSQTQSYGNAGQVQQFIYTPPAQQQDTQSTQVAMLKPPAPTVAETPQQVSSGTGITLSRNPFAYNSLTAGSGMSLSITPPAPTYQPKLDTRQYEVEAPQAPVASFGGIGKAGNPLSELMMQQQFESMQSNITPAMSSVNRNVQSNELAGGVDIASIATVPVGFNAYSFVLRDAAFYEPKEVYKNQQTVDNVRLLRGLTGGSDARHQEMVNSQYKSGETK